MRELFNKVNFENFYERFDYVYCINFNYFLLIFILFFNYFMYYECY